MMRAIIRTQTLCGRFSASAETAHHRTVFLFFGGIISKDKVCLSRNQNSK